MSKNAKNENNEENAVATTMGTDVAQSADLSAWGDAGVDSKDIMIPKILCMQSTSDLVGEGKAIMGDLVDSLTGEKLGDFGTPVKVIPFHMEKLYIISKKGKNDSRFEFERMESDEGQNYPFDREIDGEIWKYEYTLRFYVLRPEDTSLPYVINFKSTSLKAGKVLATQMFVRNRAAGLVPPAYVMEVGTNKTKNDQGTFAVLTVKASEKTPDSLIQECLQWFNTVKSGQTKVEEREESASAPAEETQF